MSSTMLAVRADECLPAPRWEHGRGATEHGAGDEPCAHQRARAFAQRAIELAGRAQAEACSARLEPAPHRAGQHLAAARFLMALMSTALHGSAAVGPAGLPHDLRRLAARAHEAVQAAEVACRGLEQPIG
jgi:hypothetical protein